MNKRPEKQDARRNRRRKETCRPRNRKRNKEKKEVLCVGFVIFLIFPTGAGNGAVTHRK